MPNWVANILEITGPAEDVIAFARRANGGKEPPVKRIQREDDESNQTVLSFRRFVFLYPTKMDRKRSRRELTSPGTCAAMRRWGTKWDAVDAVLTVRRSGRLKYTFGTAWDAPSLWLQKISRMYPRLLLLLRWRGSGFNGHAQYRRGRGRTREFPRY